MAQVAAVHIKTLASGILNNDKLQNNHSTHGARPGRTEGWQNEGQEGNLFVWERNRWPLGLLQGL